MTLDLDLDINKDFKENSLYQEGIISDPYQSPRQISVIKATGIGRFDQYQQFSTEIFAKTNRHR